MHKLFRLLVVAVQLVLFPRTQINFQWVFFFLVFQCSVRTGITQWSAMVALTSEWRTIRWKVNKMKSQGNWRPVNFFLSHLQQRQRPNKKEKRERKSSNTKKKKKWKANGCVSMQIRYLHKTCQVANSLHCMAYSFKSLRRNNAERKWKEKRKEKCTIYIRVWQNIRWVQLVSPHSTLHTSEFTWLVIRAVYSDEWGKKKKRENLEKQKRKERNEMMKLTTKLPASKSKEKVQEI